MVDPTTIVQFYLSAFAIGLGLGLVGGGIISGLMNLGDSFSRL